MTFDPTSVPEGCIYRPVPFLLERVVIKPRSVFAHTMAARKRSTVQSAWNHANAAPNTNTLPHYALGLDEADGCAKFLPTNRRGIATTTVGRFTKDSRGNLIWPTLTDEQRMSITAHGNVRDWAIGIETADTGSDADPGISAFTDYQLEMLTRIYVHEFAGWGIPPIPLPMWWGTGAATHTAPFEFPYTTIHKGKICPGSKKKAQFWIDVLPEVARRLAPTIPQPPTPDPPPTDEDDMKLYLVRSASNPNLYVVANGIESRRLRSANIDELVADLVAPEWGVRYYDPTAVDTPEITAVKDIPLVSDDELVRLGYEIDESVPGAA